MATRSVAPWARSASSRRRLRLTFRLAVLAGVALVLYVAVTFVQVVVTAQLDRARPAEAIVVLGAAQYDGRPSSVLRARLDHAVDLYERGLAPVVVVTGGRRPGDRYTEAAAAAGYLQTRGVPEDDLRLESGGESSWQSLAAAARFLRDESIDDVILVSSPYHALRTAHIAAEVGLVGYASPAAASGEGPIRAASQYVRETAAVAVGRVIGYRRLVGLDSRVERVRGAAETG